MSKNKSRDLFGNYKVGMAYAFTLPAWRNFSTRGYMAKKSRRAVAARKIVQVFVFIINT